MSSVIELLSLLKDNANLEKIAALPRNETIDTIAVAVADFLEKMFTSKLRFKIFETYSVHCITVFGYHFQDILTKTPRPGLVNLFFFPVYDLIDTYFAAQPDMINSAMLYALCSSSPVMLWWINQSSLKYSGDPLLHYLLIMNLQGERAGTFIPKYLETLAKNSHIRQFELDIKSNEIETFLQGEIEKGAGYKYDDDPELAKRVFALAPQREERIMRFRKSKFMTDITVYDDIVMELNGIKITPIDHGTSDRYKKINYFFRGAKASKNGRIKHH